MQQLTPFAKSDGAAREYYVKNGIVSIYSKEEYGNIYREKGRTY